MEIRINAPLEHVNTNYPHGITDSRVQLIAKRGHVTVTIDGERNHVDELLLPRAPSDPHSLVQRALSALGYVVGDHEKDVAQFSRWVDHLTTFPCSDEAKAIWTEAMLRLFGSDSPPLVPSTIAEASGACGAFVVEQMRLFPPTEKTNVIDEQVLADRSELRHWQLAAKENGINSPAELAESGKINFGQFVDRKVSRDWQKATGSDTPMLAAMNFDSLRSAAGDALTRLQLSEREWHKATTCETPELAEKLLNSLDSMIRQWQLSTGCETPKDVEEFRAAWHSETNCMFPKEAGDKIRTLKTRNDCAEWKAATNRETPELAKELILQIENKSASVDARNDELVRDVRAWEKATGADSPEAAIERARVTHDSWQEATGAVDSHAAYKKINDLETKLFSYASEIDALRKANAQPLVSDTASGREHAKIKAELDSKRRECATEKERADRLECESNKRGVLLAKISEALQVNNLPLIWDPLPGQVAYVKEQQQLEKMRADSESSLRSKQETWLNSIRDALGNKLLAFKDLSEHISDLKRAYDALDIGVFAPEDVADEAKVIREIIVSHLSNAGIESAAGAIAGRTVSLSASWGKTLEARKILQAKPGEGIVDAAVRITGTAWRTNNDLESAVIEARKAAGIDHEKVGSGNYTSLAQWCGAAREKLANAIIPLSKPDKVETGQRWAFVMTATDKQEPKQSPSTVGDFRDAYGHKFTAFAEDIASAFYLGS